MSRTPHAATAALIALARRPDARIPSRDRRHLEHCARCRADLDNLSGWVQAVRRPAAEPSPGVVERAWALLPPIPPRGRALSAFELARLLDDHHGDAPAAGLRSASVPVHRLWKSSAADVDVRIAGEGLGAPATLVGQVLPRRSRLEPSARGFAWLVEPGHPTRWCEMAQSGEFSLPAPQGPRWSLRLEWGRLRLRLELR